MRISAGFIGVACLLAVCAAQGATNRFHISCCTFSGDAVKTDEGVRLAAECGLSRISGGIHATDRVVLDAALKYGVEVTAQFVPRFVGRLPSEEERARVPLAKYEAAIDEYRRNLRHPAITRAFLSDEPSAISMDYLGEVVALLKRRCPELEPFVNLYPSYARVAENSGAIAKSQLGTTTYAEHLDAYCRKVPLGYLMYDAYGYHDSAQQTHEALPIIFENYELASRACRRTGRTLAVVEQLCSRPGSKIALNANKLRFQAYCAMAYGAQEIEWACWTDGWGEGWTPNAVDKNGKPTEQYYRLQEVNREIWKLVPTYMKYRNVATHLVGFEDLSVALAKKGITTENAVNVGFLRELRTTDGSSLVVGEMVERGPTPCGKRAFLVLAAGDESDERRSRHTVRFVTGWPVVASDANGPVEVSRSRSVHSFEITDNRCVIVEIDPNVPAPADEVAANGNYRLDRTRLNIGAWRFKPYLRDDAHVRELAECGIDIVGIKTGYNDREVMDLFRRYGVGCFYCREKGRGESEMPYWGAWCPAGTMHEANPISAYKEAKLTFRDHPAIWALTICDEPNALDFPYLSKVVHLLKRLYPGKLIQFDLLPNYGTLAADGRDKAKSQLGTATYAEYISEYAKWMPLDYLSYDFYPYSNLENKALIPYMYANLAVASEACRRSGRSLSVCTQVNSTKPENWTSENQLRFQAYASMAHGVEMIHWCCWSYGWWTNQVVDASGKRTQQYDKLKRVNAEIHAMGPVYMRYRAVQTHYVGFDGTAWLEGAPDVSLVSETQADTGFFRTVRAADGGPIVVADMVSRDDLGGRALLAFAADDPYDVASRDRKLLFNVPAGMNVRVHATSGVANVTQMSGSFSVDLRSNGCLLIELVETGREVR